MRSFSKLICIIALYALMSCVAYHTLAYKETDESKRSGDYRLLEQYGLELRIGISPLSGSQSHRIQSDSLFDITVFWRTTSSENLNSDRLLRQFRVLNLGIYDAAEGTPIAANLEPLESKTTGGRGRYQIMFCTFPQVSIAQSVALLHVNLDFALAHEMRKDDTAKVTLVLERVKDSYRAPPGWLHH